MTDIKNKVAESGLISLDLEKFKPEQEIVGIDIAEQLWKGLALKEKDFRNWIKENDWSAYANKAVYIYCSADAIIPTWAFMLISSRINPFTSRYLVGTKEDVEKSLIVENIQKEDLTPYMDGRVLVKGCSDIPCPDFSMVELTKRLQPIVKSLMFGEPCSTVPIYKSSSVHSPSSNTRIDL